MFLRESHQEQHSDLDHITVYARKISFHHPGYAHPNDTFLTLLAPDHSSGGLHHLTALTACGIVAGNRFDGYFSTTPNGQAIEDLPESVLQGHDYWFQVPHNSTDVPLTPYPICTSFEQWQFPHDSFPTSWLALQNRLSEPTPRLFAESSLNAATIYRDRTCRITGSEEATDVAHVIPVSQTEWFSRNDMARYGCDPLMQRSVNDVSNTILLRSDLHRTFDALKWAIIPKPNSQNVVRFVFHSIQYSSELATRYHNSYVRDITGVSPQLLFAAFARAIFSSVREFLRKGVGRWLLAISSQSLKCESRYYTGHECDMAFGATGRGRSISPKKRKGTNQQDAKEACGLEGASLVDSIENKFNNREEFECPHTPSSSEGRKDTDQQDAKEACGLEGASLVDSIENKFSNREEYECPHNPSPSEGNVSLDAIGDQDQCTCTLPSGSDGLYAADKALPSFPAYCRSANCRYRLRDEYWRRLRLDGLEKERQKSGTKEWWKSQELWADRAFGQPLSPNGIKRLFWSRGVEDATDMRIIPWEPDS